MHFLAPIFLPLFLKESLKSVENHVLTLKLILLDQLNADGSFERLKILSSDWSSQQVFGGICRSQIVSFYSNIVLSFYDY